MTFTIPDSCRDYQFRVLVVVRSTDPINQLVVFQPRAIPVELPNFSIPTEMIRLDPPRQSSDGQSLHVFVSWQIPQGYFDSDIIGYESPVAYPIRCMIPEDSLSQPRVEKVQDGARMHLNLPIDVLDENCRIYLEVRMLAKCERVVPFDVQASVELNCQKFPMLDYCKKEMSPQCAEIVDVWGENGKAQIVWQPPVPNRIPLYYSISHGVTRSQGAFPFVTRKIIQHHEIRIPGNQTRLEIPAQPGVQSGIQICAVFSERQSKNPFNIVPVIPFVCKTCGTQIQPNCIECTKVEDLENMVPIECLSQNCATNNLSTHFISMNTANLNIKDSKKENIIVNSNSLNPLQRHSKIISTDKAIPVNSDFEDQPFQTNGTLDLLFGATTDSTGSDGSDFDLTSTTSLPAETTSPAEVVEDTAAAWTTTSEEETTTIVETTVEPTTTTTKSTSTSTTATPETSTTTSSRVTTTEIPEDVQKGDVRLIPIVTPSDNSENSEEDITEEPQTTTTTSKSKPRTTQILPIIEYEKRPTNRHKIDGIRLHPSKSQKPCKQKNGIICEFGCMDNLRDLRAIYENSNKTLKLFSKQISNVLKSAKIYDKIYLEFGEIGPATTEISSSSQQGSMGIGKGGVVGDFVFTTHEKERAVITLEHTNISKLFDEIPYIMFVEKPLKVGEVNYGLSVCALNSSLVPVIMDNVFMEQSLFNDNSISSFTASF
uniref:Fibronectin type-III domain-containing protein n=1 Tax=Panagrolaimus davidi TaxID=227884 RepID=A0A914Q5Z8_9BILA